MPRHSNARQRSCHLKFNMGGHQYEPLKAELKRLISALGFPSSVVQPCGGSISIACKWGSAQSDVQLARPSTNLRGNCAVCLENTLVHALVPCGHCFCQVCSASLQNCPTCRKPAIGVQGLFYEPERDENDYNPLPPPWVGDLQLFKWMSNMESKLKE